MNRIIATMFLSLSFACQSAPNQALPTSEPAALDPKAALTAASFDLMPNASMLTLTTIKDENFPVRGSLNFKDGALRLDAKNGELQVDLSSYDSGLVLRNERVRGIFFQAAKPEFALATIKLPSLPEQAISALRNGQSVEKLELQAELTWQGQSRSLTLSLTAAITEKGYLSVKSAAPVDIKISEWPAAKNLDALMQSCGHRSVTDTVPVEFQLQFKPASTGSKAQ